MIQATRMGTSLRVIEVLYTIVTEQGLTIAEIQDRINSNFALSRRSGSKKQQKYCERTIRRDLEVLIEGGFVRMQKFSGNSTKYKALVKIVEIDAKGTPFRQNKG